MEATVHGPAPDRWSTEAWRDEVTRWVADALSRAGLRIDGPVEQPRIRPWSTQLRIPTTDGTYWFKENAPGLAHEAALVQVLAALVPDQVVVPLAVDADRGRLLSPDAGPTLATLDRTDEANWVPILQQYAALQRTVAAHEERVLGSGLPAFPPADAVRWVVGHAGTLSTRPVDDPRWVGPDQLDAVRRAADRLQGSVELLSTGEIPCSLEHNDLHANNVFVPAPGSRLRYFDFGDALWAHPFTSLWIPVRSLCDEWGVAPTDARVTRLTDAYLEVWSDLAPTTRLRALLAAAAAIAPVHRVHTWAACLDTTSPTGWGDLAAADREWLALFVELTP